MWSPHFPYWGFRNHSGETIQGSWAVLCQEGSLNVDTSLPVQGQYTLRDTTTCKKGFLFSGSLVWSSNLTYLTEVITEINSNSRHRQTFCLEFLSLSGSVPSQQYVREFNRHWEQTWVEKKNVFNLFGREIWSLLPSHCEQNANRGWKCKVVAFLHIRGTSLHISKSQIHSFLRINCWVRLTGLGHVIQTYCWITGTDLTML